MDLFASLPLTLRDTFRSGLIFFILRWLLGIMLGWWLMFMGLAVAPDRWFDFGFMQLGHGWWQDMLRVAGVVMAYLLAVAVAVMLFLVLVVMPKVRAICLAHYPMLTPVAGGSLITPIWHAFKLTGWLVVAAVGLALVPGVGWVAFPLVAATLNARGLVWDALDGLATPAEIQLALRGLTLELALLSALTLAWGAVPVLGWLTAPLLMTSGVCHLAMRRLARLRGFALQG